MQEMNEGNVYNVQDVFGSKLNSSALGIKKVNKGIKSQLFDSFKRNKIAKGIFEANEQHYNHPKVKKELVIYFQN